MSDVENIVSLAPIDKMSDMVISSYLGMVSTLTVLSDNDCIGHRSILMTAFGHF